MRRSGFEPGAIDGIWGDRTTQAVKAFQRAHGLQPDGDWGALTFRKAADLGWEFEGRSLEYTFVLAAHFQPCGLGEREIRNLVVHTTQGPERPRRSLASASWFQNPKSGGSTHYVGDNEVITQCVRERDIAHGAGGCNRKGIHFEFCDKAEQTEEDWADEFSTAQLQLAAPLFASLCAAYLIPVRFVGPAELLADQAGITDHRSCVAAYGGSHTDPGEHFPWDRFLDLVWDQARGRVVH